jgi:uncharacterized membrane protein YgcG
LPPPGFGQGGPQYGLGNYINQNNHQNQNQQLGSMGNRGNFPQDLSDGMVNFLQYMGAAGQFGQVARQSAPMPERGYTFPNQDPNFQQGTPGVPVDFMLHGMMGYPGSSYNRGTNPTGGDTSGNPPDLDNTDLNASVSLTGKAPHVHNPNLPPGFGNKSEFGNNPFRLIGIKDFGNVPILGEAMWDDWKLQVDGIILCQTWAWVLFEKDCPFLAWHTTKMWLAKSLNKADTIKVYRAKNWLEAMSELKQGHAPDDDNSVSIITEKLMTARLGDREAASTLINMMMELNATLSTLGKPFEEIHLVTAIKKALSQNTHYKQTLNTLTTIGGHQTIRALRMAFNSNVSSLVVPGAFLCDADMEQHEPVESVSLLARQVQNLQKQFKQARKPGGRGAGRGDTPGRGRGDKGGGRGGGGRGGGGRGGGGRGGGAGKPSYVKKQSCWNCGSEKHAMRDCKEPCGMCGKKTTKSMTAS